MKEDEDYPEDESDDNQKKLKKRYPVAIQDVEKLSQQEEYEIKRQERF